METIVLNNKRYILLPEADWEEVTSLLRYYLGGGRVAVTPTAKSDLEIDGLDVKVAQPKVSEYRERFKRHQLTKGDVTAKENPTALYQFGEDEFSKYRSDDGSSLFFGEGLQNDY